MLAGNTDIISRQVVFCLCNAGQHVSFLYISNNYGDVFGEYHI